MGTLTSRMGTLLLFLIGTAFTLVIVEMAFRFSLHRASKIAYSAADKSMYRYDPEFGYGYEPNSCATIVLVREGNVVRRTDVRVGPYGNLGDGVKSWTKDDFKIAVFGDSFTANPVGYNSWTEHVAPPLASALEKNVSVMNLARDGYGLLSIVHLASHMIQSTRPDFVIVAFIADDLTRARCWRTNMRSVSRERIVATSQQSSTPAADSVQDVMLVNSEITAAWSRKVLSLGGGDDPLLEKLNGQYRALQDESLRPGCTSLLLSRIRYGDPYFTLRNIPQMPRMNLGDLREDKQFSEDMQQLSAQEIPLLFVMLPVFEDFQAGGMQLDDQQRALLESFRALANDGIVNLYDESEKPSEPFEQYFLYPHDPHPSERGATWYAKAISQAVQRRLAVKNSVQ